MIGDERRFGAEKVTGEGRGALNVAQTQEFRMGTLRRSDLGHELGPGRIHTAKLDETRMTARVGKKLVVDPAEPSEFVCVDEAVEAGETEVAEAGLGGGDAVRSGFGT